MTKENLRQLIEQYSPVDEQETVDRKTILSFMDHFDDVVTRANVFGHLTASAFVVNEDITHTLMLHHNIMGGYAFPGGHADGEYDLYEVARREVEEETGLNVEPLFTNDIFAIQCAYTPGHVKRGKYISAHTHYDILFVFKVKNEDMSKIRVCEGENTAVEWRSIDESSAEDVVDWIRPINKKIVKKILEILNERN